jgi:hypothetical protein
MPFSAPIPWLYWRGPVNPGASGRVLTSNGPGVPPSFQVGGGGSPGGANTNIQYNNAGAFGGDANFSWISGTKTLQIGAPGASNANIISATGTVANPNGVSLDFTAGSGYSVGNNAGGLLLFTSGQGYGNANAGNLLFTSGAAANATSGQLIFEVGNSTGAAAGGFTVLGGSGYTQGSGISFIAGEGTGPAGVGGSVIFTAGPGTVTGGGLFFNAGAGSTTANSGVIGFSSSVSGTGPTIDQLGNFINAYGYAGAGSAGAYADQGDLLWQPSGTGQTINVPAATSSLTIQPNAAYLAATVQFPAAPVDRQWFEVCLIGNAITTITWEDNGGTAANVLGPPDSTPVNSGWAWKFNATLGKWMRRY